VKETVIGEDGKEKEEEMEKKWVLSKETTKVEYTSLTDEERNEDYWIEEQLPQWFVNHRGQKYIHVLCCDCDAYVSFADDVLFVCSNINPEKSEFICKTGTNMHIKTFEQTNREIDKLYVRLLDFKASFQDKPFVLQLELETV
jgi:hypothetical protein